MQLLPVSKTGIGVSLSGVRIPPYPPFYNMPPSARGLTVTRHKSEYPFLPYYTYQSPTHIRGKQGDKRHTQR